MKSDEITQNKIKFQERKSPQLMRSSINLQTKMLKINIAVA
jgi:hypothetical protein